MNLTTVDFRVPDAATTASPRPTTGLLRLQSNCKAAVTNNFNWALKITIFTLLFLLGSTRDGTAQFLYDVVGDTVTITGYEGAGGAVSIPATIEGKPVTAIGASAFIRKTNIQSIVLEGNVESIGSFAFFSCSNIVTVALNPGVIQIGNNAFGDCRALVQIDLPDSLQTLGTDTFQNCSALTTVTGGNGLVTIGERAFYQCSNLKSVALGPQLMTIGKTAFGFCASLESITFPTSLKTIEQRAFQYCHSLDQLDIPAGVTTIGNQQFPYCQGLASINVDPANPNYSSIDGVLFNKQQNVMLAYPGGKQGGYEVPSGVQTIAETAFSGAIHLSGVDLGAEVTTIGFAAFAACPSLGSVEIPAGVTFIDARAFTDCPDMESIQVAPGNPAYSSNDGVLFNQDETVLLQFPGGRGGLYVIPSTVTQIATFSFALNPSLTEVVVPSSVQTLENLAFYFCRALRGVYFGGEPPALGSSSIFTSSSLATGYHRPSAPGWGSDFGGIPVSEWKPTFVARDQSFGIANGRMQFTVLWSEDETVAVYARPAWNTGDWNKVSDLPIVDYTGSFTDPMTATQPAHFYQVRVE